MHFIQVSVIYLQKSARPAKRFFRYRHTIAGFRYISQLLLLTIVTDIHLSDTCITDILLLQYYVE